MARVVTPMDWAFVPRSFQAILLAHPAEPALELRVTTLDEYVARGLNARSIHLVPCVPTQDPVLRRSTVPACPSDGKYVLLLGERGNPLGSNTTYSGVQVSARHGWSRNSPRLPAGANAPLPEVPKGTAPTFSIITTVYDIEAFMLREAADSVLQQAFGNFEWLVLDNGSRLRATSRAVEAIGKLDPRIRLFRVEANLHIVRGNRYLLERARGSYVVPMDADDLLHPEALGWLSRGAREVLGSALVFADEEKVDTFGDPMEPMGRSAWSRISATSTVPCAHPSAFRRDLALALGVYTDEGTVGSHDWDTALRFADAGHRGIHVPAVLYGWRVHATSTSMSATSKPYIMSSQRRVVESSLQRRGLGRLFDIHETRVGAGYFHLRRNRIEPAPVSLVMLARGRARDEIGNLFAALRTTRYPLSGIVVAHAPGSCDGVARGLLLEAAQLADQPRPVFAELTAVGPPVWRQQHGLIGHVALLDGSFRVTSADWIWDAIGVLELDAQVGWVGGYVEDSQSNILHMGLVAGMDGGTPHYLQKRAELKWQHLPLHHRAVSGVHCGFVVVRKEAADTLGLPDRDQDTMASDVEWTKTAHRAGWIAAIAAGMTAVRRGPFEETSAAVAVPPNPGVFPWTGLDPYYPRYFSRREGEFALVGVDSGVSTLMLRVRRLLSTTG